jgi:uncharacterized membrane protein YqgA involved in biofilm formation
MRKMHWQDFGSVVLGMWLVVSPFVFGFGGAAHILTVTLGIAVMLIAVEALYLPSYLEELCEIIIALALLIMPLAGGYLGTTAAYNSYIVAGLLILLAAWEMFADQEFMNWWHAHVHKQAH